MRISSYITPSPGPNMAGSGQGLGPTLIPAPHAASRAVDVLRKKESDVSNRDTVTHNTADRFKAPRLFNDISATFDNGSDTDSASDDEGRIHLTRACRTGSVSTISTYERMNVNSGSGDRFSIQRD